MSNWFTSGLSLFGFTSTSASTPSSSSSELQDVVEEEREEQQGPLEEDDDGTNDNQDSNASFEVVHSTKEETEQEKLSKNQSVVRVGNARISKADQAKDSAAIAVEQDKQKNQLDRAQVARQSSQQQQQIRQVGRAVLLDKIRRHGSAASMSSSTKNTDVSSVAQSSTKSLSSTTLSTDGEEVSFANNLSGEQRTALLHKLRRQVKLLESIEGPVPPTNSAQQALPCLTNHVTILLHMMLILSKERTFEELLRLMKIK